MSIGDAFESHLVKAKYASKEPCWLCGLGVQSHDQGHPWQHHVLHPDRRGRAVTQVTGTGEIFGNKTP